MKLLKKMFLLLFVVSFMLVSCDIIEDGDDTDAPVVTITSVTADDTDAEIVVVWSYNDAEDVAAVAVSITPADAETQTFTDGSTTATFTGLNSGTEYTISIIATDAAGNASTAVTSSATTVEIDAELEVTLWQLTNETYEFSDVTYDVDYVTETSEDYTETPIYFMMDEGVLNFYVYSDELETYVYQVMEYTLEDGTITVMEDESSYTISGDTLSVSRTGVDEDDMDEDSDTEETFEYTQVFVVADASVDLSEAIDSSFFDTGNAVQLTDTSTSSAGRIRYSAASAMTTGSVTANVMYPTGEDQTLYVTVYGDGGASSSHRIVDLIIDEGEAVIDGMVGFGIRDNDVTTAYDTFFDTWAAIEITWDGTDATVTVDGTELGSFTYLTPAETPMYVEFKYGTNSSIADDADGNQLYAYVDDIIIIGDDEELVNENFDDLEVGSAITDPFGSVVEAVVSDEQDATMFE